jgi:hypothetical protein
MSTTTNSHVVVSREDVPVRRTTYGSGTVTYDCEHEGHKVFVQFLADGRMKLVLHDRRVRISGGPQTMSGITRSGRPFTNVGLEPTRSPDRIVRDGGHTTTRGVRARRSG